MCGVVFSCVEELSDHCQQVHQGRGLAAISRRLHDLAQLSKPLVFKCSTLLTSTGARLSALAATNAESHAATTEKPRGGGETPRRSGSTVPCPGCARGFQSRELLAAHLGAPVAGRRPPCPAEACTGCGTPFADKEMRIAHEETCGHVARCQGCPLRFGSETLLRSHVSTGRSRRGACSACLCRGCSTVLADDEARAEHEASCSAAAPCPGCRRCFGANEDLAAHISKPARMRPKCSAATCVGCGEVSTYPSSTGLRLDGSGCGPRGGLLARLGVPRLQRPFREQCLLPGALEGPQLIRLLRRPVRHVWHGLRLSGGVQRPRREPPRRRPWPPTAGLCRGEGSGRKRPREWPDERRQQRRGWWQGAARWRTCSPGPHATASGWRSPSGRGHAARRRRPRLGWGS